MYIFDLFNLFKEKIDSFVKYEFESKFFKGLIRLLFILISIFIVIGYISIFFMELNYIKIGIGVGILIIIELIGYLGGEK
ncbi:hypothetical protein H6501_02360 [Candidatus Woesearchaeota archaeon]|nr:hypothetical protein [Candidatus Woesearchaeota archaeon]USN44933.1 MAG: hypothetical protein H6500_03800 [Candidatus Woesearchaeota archaeon]